VLLAAREVLEGGAVACRHLDCGRKGDLTDMLQFDFSGRYTKTDNDLDLNVFPVQDDSDSDNTTEQLILGLNTRLSLFEGRTEHRFGINYTDIDRRDRDDYDPVNSLDYLRATNKGKKLKFDLQNDVYLSAAHTLTLGVETEEAKVDASLKQQSACGGGSRLRSRKGW